MPALNLSQPCIDMLTALGKTYGIIYDYQTFTPEQTIAWLFLLHMDNDRSPTCNHAITPMKNRWALPIPIVDFYHETQNMEDLVDHARNESEKFELIATIGETSQ